MLSKIFDIIINYIIFCGKEESFTKITKYVRDSRIYPKEQEKQNDNDVNSFLFLSFLHLMNKKHFSIFEYISAHHYLHSQVLYFDGTHGSSGPTF
jgi:hypothetical protein